MSPVCPAGPGGRSRVGPDSGPGTAAAGVRTGTFLLDTSCCPVYISSTTGTSGTTRKSRRGAIPVTKKEIVRRISDRAELTQLKTKEIVQWTFDAIIDTLIKDGRIELRNFGVFEVRRRKARRARNPRTNDRVDVPEKNVVTFQPGKEMEEKVRNGGDAMAIRKFQGETAHVGLGELQQLARHRVGEAPDPRDTVADLDDGTHVLGGNRLVEPLDLLLEDAADLFPAYGHSVASSMDDPLVCGRGPCGARYTLSPVIP